MYIFIRSDIDKTYQIIQAGHALFEHALTLTDKPDNTSSFCLLEAKNEMELLKIEDRLKMEDINLTTFYEPDHDTGFTAIAAGPIYGEQRKLFKKYRMKK